jgi:geranylgeranyl pyrophosphate synthase
MQSFGVDLQLEWLREEVASAASRRPGGRFHGALVSSSGKLLRSRVLFLAAAHGGEGGHAVDEDGTRTAAVAIELAHNGGLYHDDLVDRSSNRRGLPAVHERFGHRAAGVGGAQLIAVANALAMKLPPALRRHWGWAIERTAEGQLRDLERAGDYEVPPARYVDTARRKTSPAFELAAICGAWFGGTETAALRRFGRHFGTAFQLANDLEDFRPTGDRPPANDLRERFYTLPVLLACRSSGSDRLRKLLDDDGRPLGPEAIDEVTDILSSCGSLAMAREWAQAELEGARRELETLGASRAREELSDLVGSIEASMSWVGP